MIFYFMMQKLANLIRKADFVGTTVKPTINNKNRITSLIGGLLSIIVSICSGFGIIYFSVKMIRRTEPFNNFTQFKSEEAVIDYYDSPIILKIYDKFSQRVEHLEGFDRALKMTGQLGILNTYPDKPATIEYYEGPLKICEESMMSPAAWATIADKGYTPWDAYCLDQSKMVDSKGETYKGTMGLKNRYLYKQNKFIRLRIRMCSEEEDPGCLDFFREKGFLNVVTFIDNYYTDQLDYNSPIKSDILGISTYISPEFHQVRYIYRKINNIVTDRSMILSDTASESYYSLSSTDNSLAGLDKKERSILQVVCSVDQLIANNERRYLKIQELLANLGGLVKGMVLIAQMLSFPFSDYNLHQQVEDLEFNLNPEKETKLDNRAVIRRVEDSGVNMAVAPKSEPKKKISLKDHFKLYFSCFSSNAGNSLNYLKYLDLRHAIQMSYSVEILMKERAASISFGKRNVRESNKQLRSNL